MHGGPHDGEEGNEGGGGDTEWRRAVFHALVAMPAAGNAGLQCDETIAVAEELGVPTLVV